MAPRTSQLRRAGRARFARGSGALASSLDGPAAMSRSRTTAFRPKQEPRSRGAARLTAPGVRNGAAGLTARGRLCAMASAGHGPGGQPPDETHSTARSIALARLFPGAMARIADDERPLAERVLVAPRLSARDED